MDTTDDEVTARAVMHSGPFYGFLYRQRKKKTVDSHLFPIEEK